ncbi:MAG: DUF1569 domain-containing protein [Bacteroidetes bacterium]|nr:MAG: DUF1569 domain-containing protein [Bacteroidota bacterium]
MYEDSFLLRRTGYLLRKLDPSSRPLWGQMTPQHVLEHLSILLLISIGRIQAKPFFSEEETAQMRARFLDTPRKLPQNLPVPPTGLLPLRFGSLQQAGEKLMTNIGRFFTYYQQNPEAVNLHPAFGPLNFREWLGFHQKHFSYHFEQLGLGTHIYTPHLLKVSVPQWLEKLHEDNPRGWGHMTPQHVVEHLSGLIRLSRMDNGLSCQNPESELPRLKRFIWSNRPFQRSVPIAGLPPGQLPKLRFADLSTAKQRLLREIDEFYTYYEAHPHARAMHPVFGLLGRDEWEQFHNKHIQHHLGQQYGLDEQNA